MSGCVPIPFAATCFCTSTFLSHDKEQNNCLIELTNPVAIACYGVLREK